MAILQSAVQALGVNAKADFQRAKNVTLSATQMQWSSSWENPYESAVAHLSADDSVPEGAVPRQRSRYLASIKSRRTEGATRVH